MGRNPSLGTRILIGVLAGIAVGLFLGRLATPLNVAGKIYVGLLQMTVLPYVTVSLISKIGGFDLRAAKQVAGRAAVVQLALWAVALVTVLIMPLSLPEWDAGTFFSSTLVERPEAFDFLGLYLPVNPFHSLANNVVPAVVLFSILVGVALIGLPGKQRLLDPLAVVGEALGRISGFVVRLSPWGTFALAAGAAGILSPPELVRLAGYVSTYTIAVLFLTVLVLPGLVSAVTPFSIGRLFTHTRGTLLTVFATGKLFAVLTMIIDDVKGLLVGHGLSEAKAQSSADVLVPLAYPFPNAGKILALLFIPFAGWFAGQPLGLSDYPLLLSVGLLSFFGSPVAAIPFLLDLFRLPADLLPLFLVAGIWCARIGDVVGAMHLGAFSVICSSWNNGWLRVRYARLGVWLAAAVVVGAGMLGLNRFLIDRALAGQEPPRDRILGMKLYSELTEIVEAERPGPNPVPRSDGESLLHRIDRAGEIRVGYQPKNPPFSYRNADGDLVGLDIDLAQRLAWGIGVRLRLVPYEREDLGRAFREDHFDVAAGGIPSTLQNFGEFHESDPYLELHAALVVRDHRVREFRSAATIREKKRRIGYLKGGMQVQTGLHDLSMVELVELRHAKEILQGKHADLDGLITTAETGAIYSMIAPEFSVVVPEGVHVRVPVVFAVKMEDELDRLIDKWIRLKRADGTIQVLYDHWILGKEPEEKSERWSVLRDLLGWVD
ncbi:MAG: cation:dicarboxylate symporter family transporter [Planctomycetota bacterium]|jgi:Na+/H+-dicarboxylate symporter/ABC-type amino acid transport substrate-binding protein